MYGVSRSPYPTLRCSLSRRVRRRGRANCSPRLSPSNARAAITFGFANALELSAGLAAAAGASTLAIRLYARAALISETATRWLHYELGWPDPTPNLGDLRSRVGDGTFVEQWECGRAMTLMEAIDQAIPEQRKLEANTP
jgi:hypothetical protein